MAEYNYCIYKKFYQNIFIIKIVIGVYKKHKHYTIASAQYKELIALKLYVIKYNYVIQ